MGWFTTTEITFDDITTEERPKVTQYPRRFYPQNPTQHSQELQTLSSPHIPEYNPRLSPTHNPTPRSVRYTTHEIKQYSSNFPNDGNSPLGLPPTTTAIAIKKPVK